MFICVFMTCTLHVYDVFYKIPVMARMGHVDSLSKFRIRGLLFVLFIILESFFKFRAET